MTQPQTIVLRSRRVVTPDGVRAGSLIIQDGRIREIAGFDENVRGAAMQDYGDLVLMPGLVDTHVHVNEPGRTEWEGFESATRAAAAGGITTLVDMPLNSSPVTTTVAALAAKRAAAQGKTWVDCGFHGGLVRGNAPELASLIEAGVLGIKAFLVDSGLDEFPLAEEEDLRAAMPGLARAGIPLLVHAELAGLGFPAAVSSRRYSDYLASRPPDMEQRAIQGMIGLCREYGCPIHIVHLAAADALPMLAAARAEGLPITVETCPHYLFFTAEAVPDGDTRFKCAPPIRERANQERLWEGLRDGIIDTIASDHSPCPPDMKGLEAGDFGAAWGGIASLQLGLSVVWTEATRRGFGLEDVAGWMCRRPASLIGMGGSKGALQPGADADVVVWNPEAETTVVPENLYHRHSGTPYAGLTLRGQVRATYLRGQKVYENGQFPGAPAGQLLTRGGR